MSKTASIAASIWTLGAILRSTAWSPLRTSKVRFGAYAVFTFTAGSGRHPLIGIALSTGLDTAVDRNRVANNGEGISSYYSTGSFVLANIVHNNDDAGIHVFYSEHGTFARNVVMNDGSGFAMNSSSDNHISRNRVNGNGNGIDRFGGFHAFLASINNVFDENEACRNAGFDALDASNPNGTNTWTDNRFCVRLILEP